MRIQPPPDSIDTLDPSIVRRLSCKILRNYSVWCAYLGRKSNVWISDSIVRRSTPTDPRCDLLYTVLYLLIWGEAANLCFVLECLSYIFHNMAIDPNRILEDYIDQDTGRPALPAISDKNAFLLRVVTPLYNTIRGEVEASCNGTAPHSAWRNYDDINEYFWNCHCFNCLRWPLDTSRNFFLIPPNKNRLGKTGNIFRSFDRLWVMLILFLQAATIVAWQGETFHHHLHHLGHPPAANQ